MGSFDYWEAPVRMRTKADKFDLRLRVVQHAIQHGAKATVRLFATTPKTVRKRLSRYRQERLAGLNDLPKVPLSCPHKTPQALEQRIVALRKQFPFMGVKRLKLMHDIPASHVAFWKFASGDAPKSPGTFSSTMHSCVPSAEVAPSQPRRGRRVDPG